MNASKPEKFDLVVIGSGAAGKLLGWSLAKKGTKTVVIERKYVGGSCHQIACLPSKNVIQSAKVASYFWRSEAFGISKDNVRIDMAGVRERKRKMVQGMVEMDLANYQASGAELVMGSGRFIGPKTIEVALNDGGSRIVHGQNVVLNTGSRATIEPIPGLREAIPLTHIEALELDRIPGHLLIMGGGYVGLEFAQAMRRLGGNVTIIERNGRLAHHEDEDVSDALHGIFQDEGIGMVFDARIERVEGKSGEAVTVYATRDGTEIRLAGTHFLVAAGRAPNTQGIGLEIAGVETTPHGFIKVNERLQTTAADVWAAGDCAGSPQFTHIAHDDYRIIRENLLGGNCVTTGRQVPFCVFTDPEFARVGLNETEANERKIAYRLAKLPATAVLRTRTLSETRGFLKALVDTQSDRILGFSALAVEAGEMLAPVQIAMLAEMPFTALRDAIFPHPTMNEGIGSLFANVPTTKRKAKSPAQQTEKAAESAGRSNGARAPRPRKKGSKG